MKKLTEVIKSPSAFDSMANYMGEIPEDNWYCLLTQNRDSDALTRSNFTSALKELKGESENVRIDRFGHWACGWWESLSVKEGTKEYKIAQEIYDALQDYPVVNDEHYSDLQYEEANQYWESLSIKERVELCQKYNISVFSARHDYMPSDDTGALFEYLSY